MDDTITSLTIEGTPADLARIGAMLVGDKDLDVAVFDDEGRPLDAVNENGTTIEHMM